MTEVYICGGLRTPIGRYGGALSMVRPDDLMAGVISDLVGRHPSLDPSAIDEVIAGCANQAGEDNRNVARMSALFCWPARDGAGNHGQPLMWLWPRRCLHRCPCHPRRRGGSSAGRWRRKHEPRTLRDA